MLFLLSLNIQAQNSFFNDADKFFHNYVQSGKVDYKGIAKDGTSIKNLMDQIRSYKLEGTSEKEQLAFYINAYNVLVIQNILDNSPLKSPLDKEGFFDKIDFVVAGKEINLNELENSIIRPVFKDPRIHFVLVCGAKGCPPLISKAYFPSSLEEQLNTQTRAAMNSTYFTRIQGESAQLSQIFNWYAVDFGNNDKEILQFINKYRDQKIELNSSVSYYEYDWNINTL